MIHIQSICQSAIAIRDHFIKALWRPDDFVQRNAQLWALIDALYEFGNPRGLTPAQVALAWLMAQKPWIVPIPGTTKLAHLQENLLTANFAFTPDELKSFNETVSRIKIVGDRYTGAQVEQMNK